MRIAIHDYAGHPFQVGLSRALAARGHKVLHLYFAGDQGPKGAMNLREGDPATLAIEGVMISAPYRKDAFVQRWKQDREYGKAAAAALTRFKPDVIISGNTPLEAQTFVIRAAKASGSAFLIWVQDYYGVAVRQILRTKWMGAGDLVGRYYEAMERGQMRQSDGLVLITPDFEELAAKAGMPREAMTVIPNWALLDELPPRTKANGWAAEQGLSDKFVFLYAGTLALKHDPSLITAVAEAHKDNPDVRVVVVSEGVGASWLKAEKEAKGLDNLILLPFQPFERLPDVLGTADVVLALIEPEAGIFSVPSKVLSYLCAARAILLSIPECNLAARTVLEAGAGIVVPPGDRAAFTEGALRLFSDDATRKTMGNAARHHAEQTFDLNAIADKFESAFEAAINRRGD